MQQEKRPGGTPRETESLQSAVDAELTSVVKKNPEAAAQKQVNCVPWRHGACGSGPAAQRPRTRCPQRCPRQWPKIQTWLRLLQQSTGWRNAERWYIARNPQCQQRQAGESAALVQQCSTYRYIRQSAPASARCICSKSCSLLRSESGMSSLPRARPSQYCVLGGGGASDRIVRGVFRLAAWTRGSRATAPSRTTHTTAQIPALMPNRCFQVPGSAMMLARSSILSLGGT